MAPPNAAPMPAPRAAPFRAESRGRSSDRIASRGMVTSRGPRSREARWLAGRRSISTVPRRVSRPATGGPTAGTTVTKSPAANSRRSSSSDVTRVCAMQGDAIAPNRDGHHQRHVCHCGTHGISCRARATWRVVRRPRCRGRRETRRVRLMRFQKNAGKPAMMIGMPGWRLEHTYAELPPLFHAPAAPTAVREPRLVAFNRPLAARLGLDPETLERPEGAATFAGNILPDGGRPIAQAYAGHQFGHFTTLGDGRAILLGEQITPSGDRVDIQLKGAGPTRFSRRGDGRAALGPMLREYIISEAMHALGIPTTRSLAVVTTGEPVYRETVLQGAVLTRVAASHIRVGTMQWAAAHERRERHAGACGLHTRAALPGARRFAGAVSRAVRRDPRTAGLPDCPLAARRLHPRRDEHRQHGPVRRNDRLRPVRVHGRVRSRHGVQLHRRRRAIRLR